MSNRLSLVQVPPGRPDLQVLPLQLVDPALVSLAALLHGHQGQAQGVEGGGVRGGVVGQGRRGGHLGRSSSYQTQLYP